MHTYAQYSRGCLVRRDDTTVPIVARNGVDPLPLTATVMPPNRELRYTGQDVPLRQYAGSRVTGVVAAGMMVKVFVPDTFGLLRASLMLTPTHTYTWNIYDEFT